MNSATAWVTFAAGKAGTGASAGACAEFADRLLREYRKREASLDIVVPVCITEPIEASVDVELAGLHTDDGAVRVKRVDVGRRGRTDES